MSFRLVQIRRYKGSSKSTQTNHIMRFETAEEAIGWASERLLPTESPAILSDLIVVSRQGDDGEWYAEALLPGIGPNLRQADDQSS